MPAYMCILTAQVPDPACLIAHAALCPQAASLPGVAVALGSPPLSRHLVNGGQVLLIQLERKHPLVVRNVASIACPHNGARHLYTPKMSHILILRRGCPERHTDWHAPPHINHRALRKGMSQSVHQSGTGYRMLSDDLPYYRFEVAKGV